MKTLIFALESVIIPVDHLVWFQIITVKRTVPERQSHPFLGFPGSWKSDACATLQLKLCASMGSDSFLYSFNKHTFLRKKGEHQVLRKLEQEDLRLPQTFSS